RQGRRPGEREGRARRGDPLHGGLLRRPAARLGGRVRARARRRQTRLVNLRAPILASLLAAAGATGAATGAKPLTLQDAWSIAATRNPQVLLAKAQVARADAVVK